jgi:thioredoxin 1
MTQTITAKNFEQTIDKEGIVVLDFWAAWCGPCKTFAPVFEAASTRHPDVTWGKIDTDAEQALAGALEIRAIPTLMVFRDGVLIFRESGVMPGPVLDEIVEKVKELDMADVKRQIAEHEEKHAKGECNHDHGAHDHDHDHEH